ncbi:MAG: hypothetical protein AUI36_02790 [Cyanobacteria bacterium 13_1_40CM_2_61_4]|nr:MAG: hypothetical protein AUI36_02790 [Cyanobacteria bacterium 13_1_40CM_2_61_4]
MARERLRGGTRWLPQYRQEQVLGPDVLIPPEVRLGSRLLHGTLLARCERNGNLIWPRPPWRTQRRFQFSIDHAERDGCMEERRHGQVLAFPEQAERQMSRGHIGIPVRSSEPSGDRERETHP